MDFRRSGQLDERRRRVLREELAQPADTENSDAATGGTSAKGPVRAYCPAVLAERQPRVTDFLPIRPLWMSVAILLAVTAVAAVECTHIYARTLPLGSLSQLAALDASQRGSLAQWFATIALACGAALALVTFGIRVHRVDDYRGRYRVWLWTAAALAWGSLDAATGMHDSLGLALAYLAGQAGQADSVAAATTISWLALYALVLGTLAIRVAIEVWCSTPAVAGLALAALLYFVAALATLGMLPASGPLIASVVHTSTILLAHVAIVSTIALYARHVYLDATGRLKVHIDPDRKKGKKPRAKLKIVKEDKDDDEAAPAARPAASSQPVKFQASPPGSGPLAGKAAAAMAKSAVQSASDDEDDEDEDEDSDGGEKLSRAERRRLKKLARRDAQRRAA